MFDLLAQNRPPQGCMLPVTKIEYHELVQVFRSLLLELIVSEDLSWHSFRIICSQNERDDSRLANFPAPVSNPMPFLYPLAGGGNSNLAGLAHAGTSCPSASAFR